MKEREIKRHKITIEILRKELKDANDKKNVDQRKYEEIKREYITVLEKAKLKEVNGIPGLDENS